MFFFLWRTDFTAVELYYVVKYSTNKLGNIHSITNLAHLFPHIKKKKNLKIWKERVWGTKNISLFFIGPYIISTLWQIQGHYFISQLKLPFLYLVSYTQHGQRNECLYATDCNPNWNDLNNFNNNSPISNWIYSAVIHLSHAKRQMAKLLVHSQVFQLWTHQTGSKKSSEIFVRTAE